MRSFPRRPLLSVGVRRDEVLMMDEGLLRAIIAQPEDDALRLIYADWLEEHDRPERARLIRVQCELYQLTELDDTATQDRRAALASEVVALLKKHRAAWLAELPSLGGVFWHPAPNDRSPGGIFERGFVNMIKAESPTALLDTGERAFAVAPVQRLYMGWLGPRASRKFAQWPFLAHLRSLEALGAVDRSVAELARSPHLGSLRRLKLAWCSITAAGVEALAGAKWLGELTHLDLSSNRIDESGACALAGAPHLERLRCLDLRSNPLTAAGRRVLRERFAGTAGNHIRLLLDSAASGE
jgi:uncharacterized protein (TIGR02996 family)